MEFFLFLPQMRLSYDRLVATARAAEAAGFAGMVGMDHLEPPGADTQPMFEAMVTNAWIAAQTTRLKVGSLVMCDALRHPALLARQAVSLDHASGGRFELAIGSGSHAGDFEKFGVRPTSPRERVERLKETLEVLKALFSGERVDYDGAYHTLSGVMLVPKPLQTIPIIVGGAGPKTLALVRAHADWWNLDIRHKDKFDSDAFERLRAQAGDARVSLQHMVAYVPNEAARVSVAETAAKRFGTAHPVVGTGPELAAYFAGLEQRGVERIYAWFCDFAPPETLAGFGEEVIDPLAKDRGLY